MHDINRLFRIIGFFWSVARTWQFLLECLLIFFVLETFHCDSIFNNSNNKFDAGSNRLANLHAMI